MRTGRTRTTGDAGPCPNCNKALRHDGTVHNTPACPACAARPDRQPADSCTAVTVAEALEGGWAAITATGHRVQLDRTVVDPALRLLRSGQRLHARFRTGEAVEAWLA